MGRSRSLVITPVIGLLLILLFVWAPGGQAGGPAVEAATLPLAPLSALPGTQFVHIATAENIDSNSTFLNHPLLNGKPDALILVTQNWNPGDITGIYNDHSIGVWYNGTSWAIFNQSGLMPEGASFNVLIPDADAAAFVHSANDGGVVDHVTALDHELANNNPNAVILVTQNWNPGGIVGTYNDHPIGVYYIHSSGRWAIYNQDIVNLPEEAAFNVLITNPENNAFAHTATAENSVDNTTWLEHPAINHNPNALIQITSNWNPPGVPSTYNTHELGVWYQDSSGRWGIFTQDTVDMPENASFNVVIADRRAATFSHKATGENSSTNVTYLDHSLLNGNPNAIVHITANWNPTGSSGVYNNHNTGVYFHSARQQWAIFNQDEEDMPAGAAFSVWVPKQDGAAFVHTVTEDNKSSAHVSQLNHPLLNNNPDAIVHATANWNSGLAGNAYNDHPIGVAYHVADQRWAIFNQDMGNLPVGSDFNIIVSGPTPGPAVAVHSATLETLIDQSTVIDHPLANNNPLAMVFATPNWNPSGDPGVWNNHPIGVWYINSLGRWAIFNQDIENMPEGADFNIYVTTHRVLMPVVLAP